MTKLPDIDPQETEEWIESVDSMISTRGVQRTDYVLSQVVDYAREQGVELPTSITTDYVNTIDTDQEPSFPGDENIERKVRSIIRWNAVAMVDRANHRFDGLGGHLSTYASAASLYEVGFNHFFKGKNSQGAGDQIYYQGHAAPGIYSRAYLEGRITTEQMDHFRRETSGKGLSSYPHPRRMPDFWEFPTVSMGIGPINSCYQARFNRYIHNRGIADTSNSRVWAFCGDGEMDEPESVTALRMAANEGLDNLTFVINCNLQRLDGPVRGNGKIIQELESLFNGCGWNVIKVIWGHEWDTLFDLDTNGALVKRLNETVDGEFQKMSTLPGDEIRKVFCGDDPELLRIFSVLSDEEITRLPRGGHDYKKVYAAYEKAVNTKGKPTVILAKTIKGWTLGDKIASRNATHQVKKMNLEEIKRFRDTLHLNEITDEMIEAEGVTPYFHPGFDSPEYEYMVNRRNELGGYSPERVVRSKQLVLPDNKSYNEVLVGTGEKLEASSTMAFSRLLRSLLRDKEVGHRIVPIIPDEGRTFGFDGLFSEVKIYAPHGQKYDPVDSGLMLSYKEAQDGQILEEGITEAGSLASFTAAGTSYSTLGEAVIPFFIFYSMFGFQRVGDLIWAFGDARGKGFLLGATAGRTTLTGEGLQHCDGHSLILASTVANCKAYDPAFAYEMAVIVRDGIKNMFGTDAKEGFYYLTLYNENIVQPAMPGLGTVSEAEIEEGIIRGIYLYKPEEKVCSNKASILASGSAMGAAIEAQKVLAEEFDVSADIYSVTSYGELRNDALECERWNRLHPQAMAKIPFVAKTLGSVEGPIVAVSDFMKSLPDMISRFVPAPFMVLGTDGYGFSDTREALRRHFEVDCGHIVVATLEGLAQSGEIEPHVVTKAIEKFEIDTELDDPRTR